MAPPHTPEMITTFCVERFPDHFASVSITDDQRGVVVHRKPNPDLDKQVRARFPEASVTFRDAEYAISEMIRVHRQVRADIGYWRTQGIKITSVGLTSDRVSVSVTPGQEEKALRLLRKRHGDIIVVKGRDFEFAVGNFPVNL